MFICISLIEDVKIGEKLIITLDDYFGEIAVLKTNGKLVGNVARFSVEGCADFSYLYNKIGRKSFQISSIIKSGDTLIAYIDSSLLKNDLCMTQIADIERANYIRLREARSTSSK